MDRQEITTDNFLYNMFEDFKVCKYSQAKNSINLNYLELHLLPDPAFLLSNTFSLCGTK